jgi:mycofactocin precursor
VRKLYYNITIADLSVAVALLIGTVELMSVLVDRLHLGGGPWDIVTGLDLNFVGYIVVGTFGLTWAIAVGVWRFGRLDALVCQHRRSSGSELRRVTRRRASMMWLRPRRSWYNTTTPQSSSLHRGGGGFMRTQTKSITKSGRPGVIAPAPSPDGPVPERREAEEDVVLDDLLVEDVSIDGMCGVY